MSSGNRVFIEVSGQESRILDLMRQIKGATDNTTDALANQRRESQQLEREARKVLESLRTDQDRYNDEIAKLDKLRKANKISEDEYRRALEKTTEEYEEAERASREAHDDNRVKSMVAAMGALGAAGATVVSFLEKEVHLRREAAEVLKEAAPGLGLGVSIANTPEELEDFKRKSQLIFGSGATGTLQEAEELEFMIRSANATKDRELITRMAAVQLLPDLKGTQKGFELLRNAFAGSGEDVGTFAEAVSKAVLLAGPTTGTPDEILKAAAQAASSAKLLQTTDEELLSLTALVGRSTGLENAGDKVKELLKTLALNEEFVGQPVAETLRNIRGRQLPPADLKKFLGGDQALVAFSAVVDRIEDLERNVQDSIGAALQVRVNEKLRIAELDPDIRNTIFERRERAQASIEELGSGSTENLLEAAKVDILTRMRQDVAGGRFLARAAEGFNIPIVSDLFGFGEFGGRRILDLLPQQTQMQFLAGSPLLDPDINAALLEEMKRSNETQRELADLFRDQAHSQQQMLQQQQSQHNRAPQAVPQIEQ